MKNAIKRAINQFGYDIKKKNIVQNKWRLLEEVIENYNVNNIFDVGANRGQFIKALMHNISQQDFKYYGFEPIKEAFVMLDKITGKTFSRAKIYNIALGSSSELLNYYISNNEFSSSLLPPTEDAVLSNSEVGTRKITQVCVEPVSKIIEENKIDNNSNILLKLDVQGYELEVLKGFGKHLGKVKVAIIECSLIKNYSNRPIIGDIIQFMSDNSFCVSGIFPGYYLKNEFQLVEVDIVFVRKNECD